MRHAPEVRKTVTVVFTDVTGWTSLGEDLDPEALRRVMTRYFDEMRRVIERHGGLVEKFIGDAVMAVFGIPSVREDDALRAVRAAEEMRQQLTILNEELQRVHGVRIQIRTGVSTGEVVVGGDPSEVLATGEPVTVAARLEQTATPGEILIGEATYRLVRDAVIAEPAGRLDLKGKSRPVGAWHLAEVIAEAPGVARMLASPIVGRERELSLLRQALDMSVAERTCRAVTVVAEAGAGKSRLAAEFTSSFAGAVTVARGRCLPYGEGITFWPIAEVVRQLCDIDLRDDVGEALAKIGATLLDDSDAASVRDHVAAVTGLTDAAYPVQETFWAIRKFLESHARNRPLVVAFDDIHWAEATFLDLMEYLWGWSTGLPVLLLFSARPDLFDVRPGWGGGADNVNALGLDPLTPEQSDLVIENLVAGTELDHAVRTRICEVSEGNPLFVEEILRMLVDEDLLRRRGGRWVLARDLASFDIPPTIHALLDTRLEGIPQGERALLQRASVMGRLFSWTAVAELSPEGERPQVGAQLQALVRRAMIHPDQAEFSGEDGFAFGHVLIRDAAYRGIPKETRAQLHRQFARWLESKSGDVVEAYEETIGYHLEQSLRYRNELGPLTDQDRQLAIEAAGRLASAGERAFARDDVPATVDLLSRAVALLRADHPLRLTILPDLGTALAEQGDLARARDAFAQASEQADAIGDGCLLAHSAMQRWLTLGDGDIADMQPQAQRAFELFEAAGDERGMCRALRALGEVEYRAGRVAGRDRLIERALAHARNAGDAREQAAIHSVLVVDLHLGPVPALEGIRRCQELLVEQGGNRTIRGTVFHILAHLHAMRGEFDSAMSFAEQFRGILRENGAISSFWFFSEVPANVLLLAGRAGEAAEILTEGFDRREQLGETNLVLAALLGHTLYAAGRYPEARRRAEQASEGDVMVSVQIARGVLAKLLARDGRISAAESMARGVVDFFEGSDFLDSRAAALMDLGEVLHVAGRTEDAVSAVGEALELFDRKGHVVLAADAKRAREQYAVTAVT
jgi:class 3 adenylate cyclase/tetratricopeptide (TPR) repeat protein